MNSNQNKTIKTWVEEFSDQLYTWAYFKTSNKEIAEDLVQETFLAAVSSFSKFKNDSKPKTWLFSILKFKIADHYRKSYRENEKETISSDSFFDQNQEWRQEQKPQIWDDEDPALLDNNDFNAILKYCIDNLPANWKASVELKYIEDQNSQTICQELEISTTNYWQILHRAKLQLRKCLELNWFKK